MQSRKFKYEISTYHPHGIFAAGGALVPTQEKKKSLATPTAFSPLALVPTQEKKMLSNTLTRCSAKSCYISLGLLKFFFSVYKTQGSKALNRLRTGFSHLREQRLQHNFANTVNPLCSCALETESTDHFFLRCQNYAFRTAFINELSSINSGIISLRPSVLLEVILYGDKMLNVTQISKYLLRLSIALKIRNGLNCPYFNGELHSNYIFVRFALMA